MNKSKICFLSGNMLKIIGAVSMVIDHIGMIFFPQYEIFRIIGRLAFPIFAFFIAQGARYTKNKQKYLLTVLSLAIVCQVALHIARSDTPPLNVLVTLSLSIITCYTLEALKKSLFTHTSRAETALWALALVIIIGAIYALNVFWRAEYGFVGCMLAPIASLVYMPSEAPESLKRLDTPQISVILTGVGVLALALVSENNTQFYALAAIFVLLLYSGSRGKAKMKYFFYIFYPAHLLLLYAVSLIIN